MRLGSNLERPSGRLGAVLGPLGVLLGPLGAALGPLGAVLEPLGALLEPSWGHLRGPKTQSSEVAKMFQNNTYCSLGPSGSPKERQVGVKLRSEV